MGLSCSYREHSLAVTPRVPPPARLCSVSLPRSWSSCSERQLKPRRRQAHTRDEACTPSLRSLHKGWAVPSRLGVAPSSVYLCVCANALPAR
eukprot:5686856-Pyramimonas_sp.AAC.1